MLLERLELLNVRNIGAAQLELHPRANLFVGPNGAGKTALLEAVHLLFCGRSFRTNRAETMVRQGEDELRVATACCDPQQGAVRLACLRGRGRAELRRNEAPVRRASTVAALLPVQALLPDLGDLVFGLPATRRRWLDWGAFHWEPAHAANLRSFSRALRHRNALLRSGELATLPQWTEQVATFGEQVAAARERYFGQIQAAVQACLSALDAGVAVVASYQSGWEDGSLAEALAGSEERDVRTGTTNAGPQRADLRLACQDQPAAVILSRGQGKIVASALRLAQARELIDRQKPTLFLIDDVGAELDQAHSERFFALLGDMACQILATSARPVAADALAALPTRMFHVEHGRFRVA